MNIYILYIFLIIYSNYSNVLLGIYLCISIVINIVYLFTVGTTRPIFKIFCVGNFCNELKKTLI